MKLLPDNATLGAGFTLALTLALIDAVKAEENRPLSATARSTASLSGQVSHAATHSYLEGAVVTVDGTNQAGLTDREGRDRFNGLGADTVTLLVSFPGLDPQRISVTTPAGQWVDERMVPNGEPGNYYGTTPISYRTGPPSR